jgi:hypothetical protein
MPKKRNNQTIGFLDQGRGTTLVDCSSEGYDIGLKSEGEDLTAINFKSGVGKPVVKWHEKWWIRYLIFPTTVLLVGILLRSILGV